MAYNPRRTYCWLCVTQYDLGVTMRQGIASKYLIFKSNSKVRQHIVSELVTFSQNV